MKLSPFTLHSSLQKDRTETEQLDFVANPIATIDASYQLVVSYEIEDSDWDAFLAETPGGHHVQTSLWAQVKALLGWRTARVVVRRDEQIVAGAQILIRSLPVFGAIGYISKGPLFASDDPALVELVIKELHQIAKAHHIQYLALQPPNNGQALASQLPDWGFQPISTEMMPTATALIYLTKNLDVILADMNPTTRYNIRLGQRKEVTVREGTEHDLHTYHHILTLTGQRQNFSVFPKEYYLEMWRVFSPHGYIKLFLAEYKGEVVSAQLAIPFGDTVINKLSVWSGRYGNRRPNEVLQWSTIEWAKSEGYQYYDLEGIKPEAAKAILNQEPLPDSLRQTVTSFKLGFSKDVILFPGAYAHIHNPYLRWAYNIIFPKVADQPVVKHALNRLRTQ